MNFQKISKELFKKASKRLKNLFKFLAISQKKNSENFLKIENSGKKFEILSKSKKKTFKNYKKFKTFSNPNKKLP